MSQLTLFKILAVLDNGGIAVSIFFCRLALKVFGKKGRTRAGSLRASRFNSLCNLIFHGIQVERRLLQFRHANLFPSLACRSMMRGKAALSAGEVIQ